MLAVEFGISFFPNVGPEEKSGAHYWDEALALVDLKMPGIDGWHLGSEVHADETLTPTLVLMTPVGMSGDEAKMKLLGWFDGYLPKPVRKAQLLDTVVRLVRAAHIGAAD